MTRQPTILVIEDELHIVHGIQDILTLQGYNVVIALNGREGLTALEAMGRPPDLIVSDIMMPEMSGLQFLEEMRQNIQWVNIPLIFLTAKGEKTDIRIGFEAGVDHYLTKPFDPDDLVMVVANKLRRFRDMSAAQQEQIGELKKRILTILHHEFRTPLTPMVAYADLLNMDIGKLSLDDMREYLKGISSGADRLRRLVENFILLVELETGEAQRTFGIRKRPTKDIAGIIRGACQHCAVLASEHGVRLISDLSESYPSIVTDKELFRSALIQLIDNGVKFSDKPEGSVTVSARAEDGFVLFSVNDKGRGIDTEELEHIFEIFYQIKRHVHEDQGAGAGLPIVQRIVELHNGDVLVDSTFGVGTTFTIRIPIAQ
ncbi:MAG TPA: response regulator [Aggregatilineales bacterium]|nr:response regulator [Anaerolineales bacterium]HRE47910.1 response regulator [Aggregatilineales bacterium]